MKFGERIRGLRREKKLDQRALAGAVGVSFTYISKIENEKLDFGDFPSEDLILRLATALQADADELLLLARKIPARIRERVLQKPDEFRRLADLDDDALDSLMRHLKRRRIRRERSS
jgi:HTH-type transcriptional regulator, competence development regulator